jgi:hypothetical protein
LVIITKQEAAIRTSYARCRRQGGDRRGRRPATTPRRSSWRSRKAVARGEDPLEAVDHAVADVKAKAQEMAAAEAAREAARAAKEEGGGEAEAPAESE